MMFAAELTIEGSYHILVDRDVEMLRKCFDELLGNLGSTILSVRVGWVSSDDIEESIDMVRKGQWS